MKIAFYCQHVLGLGHFFRSLELCRALSNHEILFITGGKSVPVPLPPHVRTITLPGLMMDPEFTALHPTEPGRSVEEVKAERRDRLFELFREERPDLFLVELYPFGRKAFRFELDPVFEGIREGELPPCKVVCSLRDILVEKRDVEKYETRVIKVLSRSFDALLVHADPRLVSLDETFSRMAEIRIPVAYTGFVTPRPAPGARERIRKKLGASEGDRLVVASAGGGTVGTPLLLAVVEAFRRLKAEAAPERGASLGGSPTSGGADRFPQKADRLRLQTPDGADRFPPGADRLRLQIFSGPYMEDGAFDRLVEAARASGEGITVSRFTDDFLSYLAAADLSVSMAGYNTCMNILAAEVPALVWPFDQNREQRMRALELAERGAMTVLEDGMLAPDSLAAEMIKAMRPDGSAGSLSSTGESTSPAEGATVDLGGAENSARWLENWMKGE